MNKIQTAIMIIFLIFSIIIVFCPNKEEINNGKNIEDEQLQELRQDYLENKKNSEMLLRSIGE